MTNYPTKKKNMYLWYQISRSVFFGVHFLQKVEHAKKEKESNFLISDFIRSFKMKMIKLL